MAEAASHASSSTERALISATFDDEETSRRVFERIGELHRAALLNLTGLVWIEVARDGHLDMTTAPHDNTAPERETDAATFAQILGSLLTTPLLGSAVSGTVEAVVDRIAEDDDTPEEELRKQAARILSPGKWAVVAYASQVAEAAIRTDLHDDVPELMVRVIGASAAAGLADDAGVSP
ncbi:hypothetical protein [Humibacter sp. RRB41]|uniref:hypothetical protein n=1 Tax=Humibacter sp. RRB41 TaxID=2919946 RepID=UPI001FAAF21A|nr:hypothetical protein [Humibacter sp. RRB41]